MKIAGFICEINPLHDGHRYFIEQIKKDKPDIIIAVMSGHVSMRGEINILPKRKRTNLLLDEGIDLVMELPSSFAVNRADIFALKAIEILHKLNITDLYFGSEIDDINILKKIASFENSFDFNNQINNNKNLSYKQKEINFIKDLYPDIYKDIIKPNNTLAINYLRFINSNVNIHAIKRKTDYDDLTVSNIYPSAKSLRNLLKNSQDITKYTKYPVLFNYNQTDQKIFDLVKYHYLLAKTNLNQTNFIIKTLLDRTSLHSFDQLIDILANKTYSKSYYRRIIFKDLLNIKESSLQSKTYLRLLGASSIGLKYLNTLPNKKMIFSTLKNVKYKNNKEILIQEILTNNIASILGVDTKNIDEYTYPITRK